MRAFENKWDTNTDIPWRNSGRETLNVAIERYNAWVREGFHVLAEIEVVRAQLKDVDGGSGWTEVLDRMASEVERC